MKIIKKYIMRHCFDTNIVTRYINSTLDKQLKEYSLNIKALEGKVKSLEEQSQIQHNFLVEINKYLAKLSTDIIE
jgi:hypothetical protein